MSIKDRSPRTSEQVNFPYFKNNQGSFNVGAI